MSRILVFCTESTVTPHYMTSMFLGRSLKEQGHEVFGTFCKGIIPRCVVLDSISAPGDKTCVDFSNVCSGCQKTAISVFESYGLPAIDLVDSIPSLEECNEFIQKFEGNLADAVCDGAPIGRLALHDIVLAYKITDCENLKEEMISLHRSLVISGYMIYRSIRKIFEEYNFDSVITYNQYVQNMAAVLAARAVGKDGRIIYQISHQNVDRQWLCIEPYESRETWYRYLEAWPQWRDAPWQPDFIKRVGDDVLTRFAAQGSHIYSPTRTLDTDIRNKLSITDGSKIVVVFTSSLDEQVAQDQITQAMNRKSRDFGVDVFDNQIEWISHLVEKFRSNDARHLVVRVHPREGANKREKRVSGHLESLRAAFTDLPKNVTFIWPEDTVSSYDLMEQADVCLVAWSTIGLEAARLGIPVLTPFGSRHVYPNDVFLRSAASRDEHMNDLDRALDDSDRASVTSILLAFRWYLTTRFSSAVYIGDVIPTADFCEINHYAPSQNAPLLEQQTLAEARLENMRLEQAGRTGADRSAELEALRHELRRIVHFLLTGEQPEGQVFLHLLTGEEEPAPLPQPGITYLWVKGVQCVYQYNDTTLRRCSAAVARLAPVIAHVISADGSAFCPHQQ